MKRTNSRLAALHLALMLVAGLALASPLCADSKEESDKLVAVLGSEAPIFEKAKACQRLAVVGTKDAIPALVKLLGDESLAHYARFALEPIPDPSVDVALLEASSRLKGNLRIGVINSLGMRRCAAATSALAGQIAASDADLAAASAAALGRIGTAEAARFLMGALASSRGSLRSAVAEACLVCAEQLLVAGGAGGSEKGAGVGAALQLYDAVRAAELPAHVRAAGLQGAIRARGAEGLPLLLEALRSPDGYAFTTAVGLGRSLAGSDVTAALLRSLADLPPPRRALIMGVLADRGDRAALPKLIEAARGGEVEPRVAALRALERLGDASALSTLLDGALAGGDVASAALSTLESLRSPDLDGAIAKELGKQLEGGDARLRTVLIEVASRREVVAATPALKKAAEGSDEALSLAALRALGKTAGTADLLFLIARSISPRSTAEGEAATEALRVAVTRLPDKDASSQKVLEAMEGAPAPTRARLLGVLRDIGGARAIEAVSRTLANPAADTRRASLETLGSWQTEDAADVLLAFLQKTEDVGERRIALESFRKVVGGLRFPKEQRLSLCQAAMKASRSDDERKVVLATLAAIPAVETLAILTPIFSQAGLRDAACTAAVTIGERIARYQAPEVREAMKKVVEAAPPQDIVARAQAALKQAGG